MESFSNSKIDLSKVEPFYPTKPCSVESLFLLDKDRQISQLYKYYNFLLFEECRSFHNDKEEIDRKIKEVGDIIGNK